jgi:hypothetical protein
VFILFEDEVGIKAAEAFDDQVEDGRLREVSLQPAGVSG